MDYLHPPEPGGVKTFTALMDGPEQRLIGRQICLGIPVGTKVQPPRQFWVESISEPFALFYVAVGPVRVGLHFDLE